MATMKRKYKFSPIFKMGSVWILVFSAIGVAGAIALFMFGIAWIFMGVYNNGGANKDSHLTWGIVMMCLGSYLVLMNAFSLAVNCLAINRKSARKTLFIAVLAILAIVPMIGGIIMLFTPMDLVDAQGSKSSHNHPTTPKRPQPQQEIIVTKEIDYDNDEREIMANKLRSLKLRIDQGVATEEEKNEFEWLLTEYRTLYPKVG
ncbi:hypothetical protein JN01_0161 [Entomoplasma freundtii]|uniref:Uncharacterized protein n=1 Tax=Entomoplasma freundtii TaxID=74700 RepID=A0A2K8NS30_9MOLU|nr:hypothetical protein [Entomoplasma freundtii]ATZ16619.1 hypothetical protein EFREU_v1c05990 [Entomoplasma freundtii]TDY58214.1 hypothetical protein JN01_0161 [Entomoplasma freundtii]